MILNKAAYCLYILYKPVTLLKVSDWKMEDKLGVGEQVGQHPWGGWD